MLSPDACKWKTADAQPIRERTFEKLTVDTHCREVEVEVEGDVDFGPLPSSRVAMCSAN